MKKQPVILIFDVGKTNKKVLLFNEAYKLVYESTKKLDESKDEDGFDCEDVMALTRWLKQSLQEIMQDERFEIKAINFSAYGASFVHIDSEGKVVTPLYNYLKPYPKELKHRFYNDYGGEALVAKETASPVLGNLNSGMQLYWLKHNQPVIFQRIRCSLHLPQYLAFVLTGSFHTDITSIGCHTNLWNFQYNTYHQWVRNEGIAEKLPALLLCDKTAGYTNDQIPCGGGLHDSSAALIPYFSSFNEPFILLSTGTWCISLNPFNDHLLTSSELQQDCLCYLTYEGKPVKASRLFAGYEHEEQVKKLAAHFNTATDHYTTINCNIELLTQLKEENKEATDFAKRNLSAFNNYEEAYHQLMIDIVEQQVASTNLVLKDTSIKNLFVDGGFSKNPIYMHLVAEAFPDLKVYAASVAQATALGAALVFHQQWNSKPLPSNIIDLKLYSATHQAVV